MQPDQTPPIHTPRRPGEAVFSVFLALFSLFLLYTAYGIAGFEALSSPGALPMVASAVMVISALIVVRQTLARSQSTDETLAKHILPMNVVAIIVLIVAYAVLLKPLGFVPTSFIFIALGTKLLGRHGWFFCTWVSAVSVLAIYLIFRIIFTVLMPAGIVPEAEIFAFLGNLFGGTE